MKNIEIIRKFDPNQPRDWRGRWTDTGEGSLMDRPCFKKWFGDSKIVDENGEPKVYYHGTTHDFDEFDDERGNIENDFGIGFYFSSSRDDVDVNYDSTEGADLLNRIDQMAERLMAEDENLSLFQATRIATDELSGQENRIIEVVLSVQNPMVIGGKNENTFEYNYDEETGEETGSYIDFIEALRRASYKYYDVDIDKAISDMFENAGYDFGGATDVFQALRKSEGLAYATDENGNLASGELLREAIELAGFDGIVDNNVFDKFRMDGTYPDTSHVIAFKPNQIKSIDAESFCDDRNIYKTEIFDFIQKFDPNQPRDEDGKWTDTGASSSESSQEDNDENNQESTELTDDEIASINAYTDQDFRQLTYYEAIQDEPEKLADFLKYNRPPDLSPEAFEFKLALMSEEIQNGINKMRKNPKYQFTGNVFRGDSWSDARQNGFNRQLSLFQDAFDNDEIITYDTYMSTSTNSKTADDFTFDSHKYKIDYIIKVKNGAFIKEYSAHPTEDEVLLLPGSKFKVVDIDQDIFTDDESYLITLELEN